MRNRRWKNYFHVEPSKKAELVVGTVSLTINGASVIGTDGSPETGNVFGGGESSTVTGDIGATLQGSTHIKGDVFGGGNEGAVTGNTEVIIKD